MTEVRNDHFRVVTPFTSGGDFFVAGEMLLDRGDALAKRDKLLEDRII